MANTMGVMVGRKIIEQPLDKVWEFDSSGRMIYFGEAVPGSSEGALVWRIRKSSYTGNAFNADSQKWANGSADFNLEWDERDTYSY